MPVFPDFGCFSADNRTRRKCRGKRVPAAVFLAIPSPMGYHARSSAPALPSQSQPMTPILNTTRIYVDADACPVKDEIYRVAARHGLPVSVVAGQVHPGAAGSADRAHRGGFRNGRRRRLDCGTRRQGRYRHYLRYPAGEPLREGRRRGDRAERQAVHGTIDRHDAGGSQPDDRSALVGRSHRRPQIVRAARPLGVPVGARSDHPPHPAPAGRRSPRRNRD